MKTNAKRLKLNRETLRNLDNFQLSNVVGGTLVTRTMPIPAQVKPFPSMGGCSGMTCVGGCTDWVSICFQTCPGVTGC